MGRRNRSRKQRSGMKRHVIANLAALTAIQVSNALMPLLVFPYALSVVGAGAYARLAMTEAVMIAALTFVLYSFEVDGVARVVLLDWHREREKVSRIFSSVLWTRLAIFGACTTAAVLARPFVDTTTADLLLFWLAVPLSYAIQANWLFQSVERNVVVAAATVASRVAAAALVFVYVKSSSDVWRIPAILGACYLVAALASFAYAWTSLGIRVHRTPAGEIRASLRHGWHVFVGSLAVILYRDFNVVILGAVHGNAGAVAAYSIAEKLVKGLQATMRPLNQIYFPRTLRVLGVARRADRKSFGEVLAFVYPQVIALSFVIVAATSVFLLQQARLEASGRFPALSDVAPLVFVMVPSAYFGLANFMLGTAGLNHLGERRYLYRAILTVGAISAGACVLLSTTFGAAGTAACFTLAELMLLIAIVRRYSAATTPQLNERHG
jgi:O-antigen/teichoic acid export membrane protein